MSRSTDDKQIRLVQSSTRSLMASFRDKTESLTKCSDDIKLLLREGYDIRLAKETAERFFGKKKISFIAIDGTESQDQQLDMLIFYAGAFGYIGISWSKLLIEICAR
jgi:deoxycytidine triphosphate deaminase